ncbi:MAG: c-type cytochrome, partial [Candidatus Omnitrophica bacterium]|nr:c-type cytochrome [Candidatus Omnitrophota bacterium]
ASCHGPQGKGDGQQIMQDGLGFPLKPRDLTAGIFKGASSSEELYYRITAGLPGSPMPSYQAALSEEQIWDLIHYVQTLPKQGAEERARLHRHTIIAHKVENISNLEPSSDGWSKMEPVFVSLTPLWWRDDRIEGVEVRAAHDGNQIAIQLSWADPKMDASVVTHQSFSDGAAIQISGEKDPPFFGMGGSSSSVAIWNWKAAWQEDLKRQADIETQYPNTAIDFYESQRTYQYGSQFETSESKTSFHDPLFLTAWGAGNPIADPDRKSAAEEARAKGFGTLTTMSPMLEAVDANGVWQDGKWQVVFVRKLVPSEKERIQLKPGGTVNVAFAIWDGGEGDRNGQKMVSIWNELVLEE